MAYKTKDLLLARRANRAGASYSLRIILEARKAGIPVSLGFALVQQESDFRNFFGSDPTIYVGAGRVTKNKYLGYKADRGHTQMQGVGPVQLTWWEFQDRADRLGGCWKPAINIRVGFERLAELIRTYGEFEGISRYNGSGSRAHNYAVAVLAKRNRWHKILA